MKKKLIQVKVGDTSTCFKCEFYKSECCIRAKHKSLDCPDFYYVLMTDEEYLDLLKKENKTKYAAMKTK